jgi:hypothetical protein
MNHQKCCKKKPGFGYFVLLLLLVSMMVPAQLFAQVAGATMSGEVIDTSGASMPNAQVSIKNVGTAQLRNSVTDAAGLYSVPNLLPGSYEVTVSAPGFSTAVRTGITLTVGAQQVLNITMQIGQTSQTVLVTGEAPTVQLGSSTISGVVNQAAVVELPLNGRDWTSLAYLQPGVEALGSVQASTGSKDRAHRGYGLQMTISGARPQQNSYRIDGINVNDYSNGGPGSVEGAALGVDAIQEFSVLTSNYSTEYGRTSGGVVNAISKSGTNSFHGDAYEFLRNSALDARNFFDPVKIPEYRQNQFGAALGGPIWKDKTFFFTDYEGLRVSQGVTTLITVPSQALRNGVVCSIPQPGPGGCTTHNLTGSFNPDPATGIDKAVLPYLALWQLPNAGLLGNGDIGTYSQSGAHITTENFITARIDHKFSENDLMFGSFEFDPAAATEPDPTNNLLVSNKTGRSFIAIEETHIFSPQWINTARIGFNRSVHLSKGLSAINPAAANPALGVTPGADNPQLDVPWGPSVQPGLNQVEQLDYWNNSYQAYDDVFFTKGVHSLKFGFAVEKLQLNEYNPAPATEYAFNSNSDFLNNIPSFVLAPVPGIQFPHFGFRSTIVAGYVQDDIRVHRNLTLNIGMRYEMSTVPSEAHGLLSIVTSPYNQSLATAHMGNGIFRNPTTHNFEPRVGFAWDPFGDGKSSVRGGFGMFDVLPLPYFLGQIASAAAPFAESGFNSTLSPGDFPAIAFTKAQVSPFRIPYIQQHPGRPYVMQWNLNVQRELVPNLTAMLAYVGSRGVHMPFRSDDINTWQPTATSAGYLWPNPSSVPAPSTLSPNVGQMDVLAFNNNTSFDGLEAQIVKRMSHGLQIQGSYTWSRAIDGGDGSIASDAFLNALPGLLYFLPSTRRGPSDFNVTHNLTVNFIWDIPTPGSLSGRASRLVKGWQGAGIFQVRGGLPFTPLISGDPLGLHNYAPFAYPDIVRGPGCTSLVSPHWVAGQTSYLNLNCFALPVSTPAIAAQCVPFSGVATPGTCSNLLGQSGRNSVYGPRLINFDFSLIKDTKIWEHVNLQFRAEFFNVFNHSNFQAPISNSTLFNSDGTPAAGAGVINSTSTLNRVIQFGLKLIF